MAKEAKTQDPVQPAATPAEPTATPVAEPAAPAQPVAGGQEPGQEQPPEATLEGGPGTEPLEISWDRLQELYSSEKKLKETNQRYGKAIDEVGELRKQVRELKDRTGTPIPPQPAVIPDDLKLTDEDFEDPARVTKKWNKVVERLTTPQTVPSGITVQDVRNILLQEKAVEVIESDPLLQSMGFDEKGIPRAMGLIDQAAAWAVSQNEQAGRIIYRDPKSAWEGFKKALSGTAPSQPTMTAQEARKVIVKQVKQAGTPAVSVGPSGTVESMVDKFKNLLKTKDSKQISAFYSSLSDADKRKIDLAVGQMDEGP